MMPLILLGAGLLPAGMRYPSDRADRLGLYAPIRRPPLSASLINRSRKRGRSSAFYPPLLPLFALLLTGESLQAAPEIAISQEQMERIGINLVAVETAESYVTDHLPARVSVPPQQAWVLSAPRGGLVTAMTAAESDEVKEGDVLAQIESPGLVSQCASHRQLWRGRLSPRRNDRQETLCALASLREHDLSQFFCIPGTYAYK